MNTQKRRPKARPLYWMVVFGVAVILCLTFLACQETPGPVKLGLAVNLSGSGGTAGGYIRQGAMLAAEEINRRGGIKGRELRLIVKDDRDTLDGIESADNYLIQQKVVAIIGHSYSQSTLLAYSNVMAQGTLLFTPYTGTLKLSGKDDLFFRTCPDTATYGRALAKYLKQKSISDVAFLMDMSNPSFVQEYVDETQKHLKGRLHLIKFNRKKPTDWDAVIDQLTGEVYQAVVLLTEVRMTALAAQKIRAKGFKGPLIATLWAQTLDLMKRGGQAVQGMTIITFIPPVCGNPRFEAMDEKVRNKFNQQLTARSVRAYEAVDILAQALSLCPVMDSAHLEKALLSHRFESVMGPVSFDAHGDVMRPVYALRVEDSNFVMEQTLLEK